MLTIVYYWRWLNPLQWRHNGRDGISNHQPHDCLLKRLFKKTPTLRVTGLCAGNSPVTGELPAQMASNAENVSIWWRHNATTVSQVQDGNHLLASTISYGRPESHFKIKFYRKISRSHIGVWSVFRVFQLLWYLAGVSAAELHLPSFKGKWAFNTQYHGYETFWNLTLRRLMGYENRP